MNCAIYIRVSQESQALKGHSLDAQEKEGIRICKQNGWSYQVFKEAGRSADKDTLENRPQLQKILELADEEKIKYCFVTELDRLSRNPITLAYIKKVFSDNDVKVVTRSQTFDFKDDEDDFISDLLGLLAKRENRLRVKRSKRGLLESILKGGWVGGAMPYGYRRENKKIVPDPEEKKTYSMMVDWSLEGKGSNTIARTLNDMGVKTRATGVWKKWAYGGRIIKNPVFKWKSGTVLRILKNPLYKGEFIYKGHKISTPALISKEKWQQIQDNLKKNYNNAKRDTKRFYLLRGLLYCKKCGRRLFGFIKLSRGMRLYSCLSKRPDPEPRFCGLKNINLDKLNHLVWEKSREIALSSSKLKTAIESQREDFFVNGVELEVQITQLERLIQSKDEEVKDILRRKNKYKSITEEDIEKVISDIKNEKNDLLIQKHEWEDRLNKVQRAKEQAKHIENYFKIVSQNIDKFSEQERYEFLHTLIDRIIIDYDETSKKHTVEIVYIIPTEETPDITHHLRHSDRRGSVTMGGKKKTNKYIELRIVEKIF